MMLILLAVVGFYLDLFLTSKYTLRKHVYFLQICAYKM